MRSAKEDIVPDALTHALISAYMAQHIEHMSGVNKMHPCFQRSVELLWLPFLPVVSQFCIFAELGLRRLGRKGSRPYQIKDNGSDIGSLAAFDLK